MKNNVIKIRKKEEPFEALMYDGENLSQIGEFCSPHVVVEDNESNSLWVYIDHDFLKGCSNFQLKVGEYVFASPKDHIGKITQEIIDRSWEVISEHCEKKCGDNYCDENGCVNRKRHLTDINEQPQIS